LCHDQTVRHRSCILICTLLAFALARVCGLHFHVTAEHHHLHDGAAHQALDLNADHLINLAQADAHDVEASVLVAAKVGGLPLLPIVFLCFGLALVAAPLRVWRTASVRLRPPRARGAFTLHPPSQAPPALA
jgi:hypothetical protein